MRPFSEIFFFFFDTAACSSHTKQKYFLCNMAGGIVLRIEHWRGILMTWWWQQLLIWGRDLYYHFLPQIKITHSWRGTTCNKNLCRKWQWWQTVREQMLSTHCVRGCGVWHQVQHAVVGFFFFFLATSRDMEVVTSCAMFKGVTWWLCCTAKLQPHSQEHDSTFKACWQWMWLVLMLQESGLLTLEDAPQVRLITMVL